MPSVYYEFAIVLRGTIGPGIVLFAISIRCVCTHYLICPKHHKSKQRRQKAWDDWVVTNDDVLPLTYF